MKRQRWRGDYVTSSNKFNCLVNIQKLWKTSLESLESLEYKVLLPTLSILHTGLILNLQPSSYIATFHINSNLIFDRNTLLITQSKII